MIEASQLSDIGRTIKPHGINGEIAATIDADIDIDTLQCIVLDIDGIFVPFFINSYRSKGSDGVLLSIDGIDNEKQAADLCSMTIYGLTKDLATDDGSDEDAGGVYISDLIGFQLQDSDGVNIGQIADYDDSTANTLLIVTDINNNQHYIPLAEDLIHDIDIENQTIKLNIANGLLDL